MSSLPFLHLPFLSQIEILNNLGFFDVTTLSTISNRCHTLIRSARPNQVDNLHWDYSLATGPSVFMRKGNKTLGKWETYSHICKQNIERVLKLFRIKKQTLYMDTFFAVSTLPVFKYVNKFERVRIKLQSKILRNIAQDAMDFFLDQLQVRELQIYTSNFEGKKYKKFISVIVKKWMSREGLEHLEKLEYKFIRGETDLDLRNIETVQIDETLRPLKIKTETSDIVRDIKRKDGKIATLVLKNDRFKVLVWPY